MNQRLIKQLGVSCLLIAASVQGAMAATSNSFVEEAAQGGINEIESGKLALQKSSSEDIKSFANQMISDHGKANTQLTELAKKLDIEVPDEASLTEKAKKMILEMRDESFDKSYANNQVMAHEQTITLFKKEAASSQQPELKAFAQETLPKLEHHLEMAKKLQAQYAK